MDYFKHYSTASDSKSLNAVFDKFGHKGIAFWWMLVELCCEHWDGKSNPDFVFHQRTVASKLKSSPTSVRPWLELCSTLGMCAFANKNSQFEIKIPKLLEVKTSRTVIKSNKIVFDVEENRREENRDNIISEVKKNLPEVQTEEILKKPSPLSFLFSNSPEIQEWLNAGIHETHLMLLKKFSHHELVDLVEKAFAWAVPRGIKAETWLYTFVSNKKTTAYGSNSTKASFKKKSHGVTPTPDNPTGDPYQAQLNEIRKKGEIA